MVALSNRAEHPLRLLQYPGISWNTVRLGDELERREVNDVIDLTSCMTLSRKHVLVMLTFRHLQLTLVVCVVLLAIVYKSAVEDVQSPLSIIQRTLLSRLIPLRSPTLVSSSFRTATTTRNMSPSTETPSLAPSPKYPNVKLVARPSQERGHADHGWLKTFHTFSFASYVFHALMIRFHKHILTLVAYDSYLSSSYNGFGALRVINEDRVEPSTGFGKHSHREMEIFSYIVSGELEHQDTMGNLETMKRGDVQVSPKGTIVHHKTLRLTFLFLANNR